MKVLQILGSLYFMCRHLFLPSAGGQAAVEEEFDFKANSYTMRGTLVKPAGSGPFPVTINCHGSGQMDRQAGLFISKPFLKAGIAFFSYDKIGVGKSSGEFYPQSLSDRAEEIVFAIEALKKRSDIDGSRIGVAGGSQAGYVVPGVARLYPSVDHVVLLSPGAWSFKEELKYQQETGVLEFYVKQSGVADRDQIDEILRYAWANVDHRIAQRMDEELAIYEEVLRKPWFSKVKWTGVFTDPRLRPAAKSDLVAEGIAFNAVKEYSAIRCPTLVLFGSADQCVSPDVCSENIRNGFRLSGNDNLKIIVYPGADHGLSVDGKFPDRFWADLETWLKSHVEENAIRNGSQTLEP